MLVDTIFQQKLIEIQSRVPISIQQVQVNQKIQEKADFQPLLDQKLKIAETNSSKVNGSLEVNNLMDSSSVTIPSNDVKQEHTLMSQIEEAIDDAAYKYKVPAPLIKAMIRQESNFDPNCTSTVGAVGLMQLMPDTAVGLGISNPFDIRQNIDGGTKYIKQLLTRFNSDFSLAIAAYNAGPSTVKKFGGVPPFKETQNHVRKVMKYYHEYKYAQK